MSIYATLWALKFPKEGDEHLGCEWIGVRAQAVPAHVGSPTPGCGYYERRCLVDIKVAQGTNCFVRPTGHLA
jgi:hypothetical protein